MKILLFGKNGQVGWELQRSLAPLGELVAVDFDSVDYCGDFANSTGITETVRKVAPDIIVNAAAYTAVDKAETETDRARILNAQAPAILAREAQVSDAWLIHYSTDYVFDGAGQRYWQETDSPNPLNVYGKTKLEGDLAILESGCKHLIFRTSWVYAARGGNFAKTMLRLAQEREELNVINDQFGAPTGAELIADITAHSIQQALQRPEISGLYHVSAAGATSWYDYARFVIDFAHQAKSRGSGNFNIKLSSEAVKAVPSGALALPATRPGNSRLDTHKFRSTFNLNLPPWQSGVTRMLAEIGEKK